MVPDKDNTAKVRKVYPTEVSILERSAGIFVRRRDGRHVLSACSFGDDYELRFLLIGSRTTQLLPCPYDGETMLETQQRSCRVRAERLRSDSDHGSGERVLYILQQRPSLTPM